MQNTRLLIVHHSMDMDGIFSGLYANKLFGNFDNLLASFDYYDNEENLNKIITENEITNVLFVDVTPSIEWFKENYGQLNITIIDHHFAKLQEIVSDVIDEGYRENHTLDKPKNDKDLVTFYAKEFDMFYSDNSATKTIELLYENTHLPTFFERKGELKTRDKKLINLVDMYDVWKWEGVIKDVFKTINPDKNYNLFELCNDYLSDGKTAFGAKFDTALEAYMFNYSLNKMFKKVREMPSLMNTLLGLNPLSLSYINVGERDTRLFITIIKDNLLSSGNEYFYDILNKIILDGFKEYYNDYFEVKAFFELHPNINSIVEEVNFNGFNYVICNYKFSNIIRDYFYNNVENLHFMVFPRFEGLDKYKVTGRTIQQNSFNVGKLMKDVYNGGGHFNAGGGTIKGDKIDIENLNHRDLINEFIIKNY